MLREKIRSLGNRKALVAIIIAAVCLVAAAPFIAVLPASAEEKAEQRIKDKVGSEFGDLDKVELTEELEGITGKYYQYSIYNGDGEMIGMVTEDSTSGDILSIGFDYRPNYGDPKLSLEDAHKIANDYLAKWGYKLSEDYSLVKEEVFPAYSDVGDQHAYIFQLDWVRRVGDITIPEDGCSMEIDAVSGNVIYCSFPAGISKDFGAAETIQPKISEEQAVTITRSNCPSPESWYQSMDLTSKMNLQDVDIKVTENVEYVYMNIDGEYHLIERVRISYKYYPKQVESNDENLIGSKEYIFDIDGVSGEILCNNETR